MVDQNGKLFGKINLVDLLIILVLIALVAFVGLKVLNPNTGGANLAEFHISFHGDEVPDYVVDVLEEGTNVFDGTERVDIGTVVSFEVGEPIGYETNANGEIQMVTRQNHSSVDITALARGEAGSNGVTINGVQYGVGHTLVIFAGNAKLYLKVSAIEPAA